MHRLAVTCYGAGSEVGRSCILVKIAGKRILLDCGVNIGTSNPKERLPKLPDQKVGKIDLVLISHIHSDHIASLPWLTEVKRCQAPIFMTCASQMLSRIMLEDFLKVTENPPYTKEQLNICHQKIHGVEFNQRHELIPGVFVTAYPAGHLLGATAFHVSCHGLSFLYTGDFSGPADHHLSGHAIPRLFPDLLITESTYGNRVREPMYKRERSFVQQVHKCVMKKGKVLIPVFAVGRLQEICLMLNDYWERMDCKEPIYFASGMGAKATEVYKKCIQWMNPTVQSGFYDMGKKTYNFSRITKYDSRTMDGIEGPCVMVATSGMLNNGSAYEFFVNRRWYSDPKNLIVFPGYCGERTLGRAILERGEDNRVVWESPEGKKLDIVIQCQVERVSFSAHADQFEIVTMCERLRPKSVVTVHGDNDAVGELAKKIAKDLSVPAHVATLCNKINIDRCDMRIIDIDKECLVTRNGITTFEGAIEELPNKVHITPLKHAALKRGSTLQTVVLKRRVKTTATPEEVTRILRDLHIIDETQSVEWEVPLRTQHFVCELKAGLAVISYNSYGKRHVNKFSCLLSRFS